MTTPRHGDNSDSPERQARRVSGFLSLGHIASAVQPLPLPPIPGAEPENSDLLVREQDRIWHNPSPEQMIDALAVAMMTKPVLGPVPIKYNANILHLMEGFGKLQRDTASLQTELDDVKCGRLRDLEQFRGISDEWLVREAQYKAEIKRLEVIISRTSRDGLEAVALARTTSLVSRGGQDGKRFRSRVQNAGCSAGAGITIYPHGKSCLFKASTKANWRSALDKYGSARGSVAVAYADAISDSSKDGLAAVRRSSYGTISKRTRESLRDPADGI